MEQKKNDDPQIMVSVCICTYNHENYIKQTLDSVLSQKADFNIEILIGDDASSDKTQEILTQYAKDYPQKIKVILRKKNTGGTKNGYQLYQAAKGKYIVCLDGDDFWCDETKLQKQVDFLESNPRFSACSHWCVVVDANNQPVLQMNQKTEGVFWHFSKEVFTKEDFEKGSYSGQSSTTLFRNFFLNKKLDYSIVYKAHYLISDRTMQMLAICQGDIYVMHERMSCYRYIEAASGNNWQSKARYQNRRGEEFHYICKLEAYARKTMKVSLELSYVKKDKIICGAVVFLNHPSRENGLVLLGMVRDTKQPIRYTVLVIRSWITKLYYRKILKQDLPIKL